MDKYKVRIIPLGGILDVTMNMYVYEIYVNDIINDIIIVDCGIGFPKEQDLGVDLKIPDISYLKDKVDKIRAVILTHGHEDHISGLSYHYKNLSQPPIYTSKLTSYMIQSKLKEADITASPYIVDYNKEYQFGLFKIRFIHMTHSIPDPMHVFIKTPAGNFYHGPDYKFDLTPPYGLPPDFFSITGCQNEGVMCLLSDCLGVEREGLTMSESAIGQTFDELIRNTKGKFLMTTFSSNISRIRQCAESAVKYNRKICFLGRSVMQNIKLAQNINYFPIPKQFIIKKEDINKHDSSKICLIVAGSQGQFDSALSKIANDQNPHIKIGKHDRVLFSSDPIPGNEEEVTDVINRLYIKGADVIYPDIQEQLHASGHGNKDDLKLLIALTKPKYLIPIGGTVRFQQGYKRLAEEMNYPDDKVILLKDGQTVWFENNNLNLGQKLNLKSIYVDAYGIGDVGNVVLRDRNTIGKEGIVFVVIPIAANYDILKEPELITRGFVFEKMSQALLNKAKASIKNIISQKNSQVEISREKLEREIINSLEQLFYQNTGRKPLIVVELIII